MVFIIPTQKNGTPNQTIESWNTKHNDHGILTCDKIDNKTTMNQSDQIDTKEKGNSRLLLIGMKQNFVLNLKRGYI